MEYVFFWFLLCFLPSLVAVIRNHSNKMAIEATNLFLGWTVFGWIVSLIWSCTDNVKDKRSYDAARE